VVGTLQILASFSSVSTGSCLVALNRPVTLPVKFGGLPDLSRCLGTRTGSPCLPWHCRGLVV